MAFSPILWTFMDRTLLIKHNWHDRDESKWLFWLEKKLIQLGFSVTLSDLPEEALHDTETAVQEIEHTHGIESKNVHIIRHDPGCLTLLKYCEQLLYKNTMEPTLLVAGIPKQNHDRSTSIISYNPAETLTLNTMDIKLMVLFGGQLVKALPGKIGK
jgi:predicted alpha/beta hydrolase family esterase